MRSILTGLDSLLKNHPRVEPASIRVRFMRFGSSALELDVFAYVTTPDWPEFLKVQEDLLLRFMDTVEAAGAHIALQSPVYVDPTPASRSEQLKSLRQHDQDPHLEKPGQNVLPEELEQRGTQVSGKRVR
jgi:small-conductance mechanosensitive channel